jgi:LmbE family N-acetylglucosaminyl deacetylase
MAFATVKLGVGRDETYWTSLLEELPVFADPPSVSKVLLLAPHPDDEVLACGGLLQRWSRLGSHIDIWMITDGEACFGDEVDANQVATQRRREATEAHKRLGVEATVNWLELPDSNVASHTQQLRTLLNAYLDSAENSQATLIAPLPVDGHPDHDCVGAIAYDLAMQRKLLLLQYPIWMWHSGSSSELQKHNVFRTELSAAEKIRKADAIAAFSSQIQPERGPAVLPRSVLRHFRRSFEVVFVEDFRVNTNSSAIL